MTFILPVALTADPDFTIALEIGSPLFLLGANGTGKSSLLHRFYTNHAAEARRITAHRQNWFNPSNISFSPEQKRQNEQNITSTDHQPDARWLDHYAAQRPGIAIYEMTEAENVRARKIAGAADADDFELVKQLRQQDAPLKVINELVRQSGLTIQLSIDDTDRVVARRNGGDPYSIAELSDGERNAILIAASILTAKPGALLLIDEPERHLHRSIISPLLAMLFARRDDCAFVVSTHDIALSSDYPEARILLVRECIYEGNLPKSWNADLLEPNTEISEEVRRDILGTRRTVVFIEGTETSLDKPLYSLLFPSASIVSKASCRDVETAVAGIRSSDDLHWISAYGIIDNDRRPTDEIVKLKNQGVYALSVYAVESIYYHPEIQRRVAARHEELTGEEAAPKIAGANAAVIAQVRPQSARLVSRAAERLVREEFFRHLPTKAGVEAGTSINVQIDVGAYLAGEAARLDTALNGDDIETLVCRYPIRDTPALGHVATKLGFRGRSQYEKAVRKLLMDDVDALAFARSLFDGLDQELIGPAAPVAASPATAAA